MDNVFSAHIIETLFSIEATLLVIKPIHLSGYSGSNIYGIAGDNLTLTDTFKMITTNVKKILLTGYYTTFLNMMGYFGYW